jgi:hypothetical protein
LVLLKYPMLHRLNREGRWSRPSVSSRNRLPPSNGSIVLSKSKVVGLTREKVAKRTQLKCRIVFFRVVRVWGCLLSSARLIDLVHCLNSLGKTP